MSSISSGRAPSNSLPPSNDPVWLLAAKLIHTNYLESPDDISLAVDRLITPGGGVALSTESGINLLSFSPERVRYKTFSKRDQIHYLVCIKLLKMAGSGSTLVSPDKEKGLEKFPFTYTGEILDANCDFKIQTVQGYNRGHIIDKKYTVKGSHIEPENYFPTYRPVNYPIKEVIVTSTDIDAYVEFPLFSPNPPCFRCRSEKPLIDQYPKQFDAPVPIGVLYFKIFKNNLKSVYFFPNNEYDYATLEKNVVSKKVRKGHRIRPCFKIKKKLYSLLRSALLSCDKIRQSELEKENSEKVKLLTAQLPQHENTSNSTIQKLSKAYFENNEFPLHLFLRKDKRQLVRKDPNFKLPFYYFGKFLVEYTVKNCLKSEYLQTEIRTGFISMILTAIKTNEKSEVLKEFVKMFTPYILLMFDEFDSLELLQSSRGCQTLNSNERRTIRQIKKNLYATKKTFSHESDHPIHRLRRKVKKLCKENKLSRN